MTFEVGGGHLGGVHDAAHAAGGKGSRGESGYGAAGGGHAAADGSPVGLVADVAGCDGGIAHHTAGSSGGSARSNIGLVKVLT